MQGRRFALGPGVRVFRLPSGLGLRLSGRWGKAWIRISREEVLFHSLLGREEDAG